MKVFGGFISAVRDGTVVAKAIVFTRTDETEIDTVRGQALSYARVTFLNDEGWAMQNADVSELPFLVERKS